MTKNKFLLTFKYTSKQQSIKQVLLLELIYLYFPPFFHQTVIVSVLLKQNMFSCKNISKLVNVRLKNNEIQNSNDLKKKNYSINCKVRVQYSHLPFAYLYWNSSLKTKGDILRNILNVHFKLSQHLGTRMLYPHTMGYWRIQGMKLKIF